MLELTREQHQIVVASEMRFQLTVMKQYLTTEDKAMYIEMLRRNYGMLEFEYFMNNDYKNAWPRDD